jgi:hypothetical protein
VHVQLEAVRAEGQPVIEREDGVFGAKKGAAAMGVHKRALEDGQRLIV